MGIAFALSTAQQREIDKRMKSHLKMSGKIKKMLEEFDSDHDTFKALCIEMGVTEYESKVGKLIIVTPEKTDWDTDAVMRKLTGDEINEYFPATAKKAALTARVKSDPAFAARVAECFEKQVGTPTLTVKPV